MIKETIIVLILGIMLLMINERIITHHKISLEEIKRLNVSVANVSSITSSDIKTINERIEKLEKELVNKENEIKMLKR